MKCDIEVPPIEGLKDGEITVGRDFILHCQGEWPASLDVEKINLNLLPEQQFLLKLRKFEFRDRDSADLYVVSYVAGKMEIPELTLSAGEQTVSLGRLQFEVVSSIQEPAVDSAPEAGTQATPPQPQPFGPIGPAWIAWPIVYSLLLAALVTFLVSYFGVMIFRRQQRKRLLLEIADHDSALEPAQKFFQELRKLNRTSPLFYSSEDAIQKILRQDREKYALEALEQINGALRLYLAREFKIPAFQWRDAAILKDLKKYHRNIYKKHGASLAVILKQLGALKSNATVEVADILVLHKRSLKWVEALESEKGEKK